MYRVWQLWSKLCKRFHFLIHIYKDTKFAISHFVLFQARAATLQYFAYYLLFSPTSCSIRLNFIFLYAWNNYKLSYITFNMIISLCLPLAVTAATCCAVLVAADSYWYICSSISNMFSLQGKHYPVLVCVWVYVCVLRQCNNDAYKHTVVRRSDKAGNTCWYAMKALYVASNIWQHWRATNCLATFISEFCFLLYFFFFFWSFVAYFFMFVVFSWCVFAGRLVLWWFANVSHNVLKGGDILDGRLAGRVKKINQAYIFIAVAWITMFAVSKNLQHSIKNGKYLFVKNKYVCI